MKITTLAIYDTTNHLEVIKVNTLTHIHIHIRNNVRYIYTYFYELFGKVKIWISQR